VSLGSTSQTKLPRDSALQPLEELFAILQSAVTGSPEPDLARLMGIPSLIASVPSKMKPAWQLGRPEVFNRALHIFNNMIALVDEKCRPPALALARTLVSDAVRKAFIELDERRQQVMAVRERFVAKRRLLGRGPQMTIRVRNTDQRDAKLKRIRNTVIRASMEEEEDI
jgi:hypothetical protein